MSKCRYDLSKDCHGRDCLVCTLDKIRAEIDELPSYVAKFNGGDFAIHIDKKRCLRLSTSTRQKVRTRNEKDMPIFN